MCQSAGDIHLALLYTRKNPPSVPLPSNPNHQLDSLYFFLHSTPRSFNEHLLYTKDPILNASFPPPLEALIPPSTISIWPLPLRNVESSQCTPTVFWLGPLPHLEAIFPTASPSPQLIQKHFSISDCILFKQLHPSFLHQSIKQFLHQHPLTQEPSSWRNLLHWSQRTLMGPLLYIGNHSPLDFPSHSYTPGSFFAAFSFVPANIY